MDEPIEVNRKYIKIVKDVIEPQYTKHMDTLFILLKQEIDKRYLKKTS